MFSEKKHSVTLIHGVFPDAFFCLLRKKGVRKAYVLEGRPYLDGAKKTCQALLQHKMNPVLIADNMTGFLFFQNWVKNVWVSYQEINQGQVLCKVGSLGLGIMAKKYGAEMMAFPSALRKHYIANPKDIFFFEGTRVCVKGVHGFVPLIEDVPKKYLSEVYE